jgi:hypothetical protein
LLSYGEIDRALRARGLVPRGAFHPDPADRVPTLPDGRASATLVLAGNAGPEMWRAFQKSRRAETHPLNAWSRRHLGELARELGATALFPFDGPPYLPFQRWAQRAEAVHPSPLGILIHPDYGLWHGYRGALAFGHAFALPRRDRRPNPCEACADKPCLTACPAGAFGADGYDVAACVGHLKGARGGDCLDAGCAARRACPIGRGYRYEPARGLSQGATRTLRRKFEAGRRGADENHVASMLHTWIISRGS